MRLEGALALAVALGSAAFGQTTFERFFGQNGWPDAFMSVVQTSDNGFAAAGYTESYGAVAGDFWFVRTDSLGRLQWMSMVSGLDNQYAYDVKPVWDGGFVAVGCDYSGSGGTSPDVLLVRYTPAGDTVWTRRFGSPGDGDAGYAVAVSPDSCFVAASWTFTPNLDLIKVAPDGNLLWGRSYPALDLHFFTSVERTGDGYILCGTALDPEGVDNVYLVRTDWNGDTVWTRAYRFRDNNCGHRARPTSDGGFIVSGSISDTAQPADASLLKLNAAGDTEWVRTFPETYLWYNNERATDVLEDTDGGFLLLAPAGGLDTMWPLLIKVDRLGNKAWTQRVGSLDQSGLAAIARTRDGGLVMAGGAELPDSAYEEAYLVKTDGRGLLAVDDRRYTPDAGRFAPTARPNPFRQRVTFALPPGVREATVTVADAMGRVVYRSSGAVLSWDARELPAGVYCYRISAGASEYRGRLLKIE